MQLFLGGTRGSNQTCDDLTINHLYCLCSSFCVRPMREPLFHEQMPLHSNARVSFRIGGCLRLTSTLEWVSIYNKLHHWTASVLIIRVSGVPIITPTLAKQLCFKFYKRFLSFRTLIDSFIRKLRHLGVNTCIERLMVYSIIPRNYELKIMPQRRWKLSVWRWKSKMDTSAVVICLVGPTPTYHSRRHDSSLVKHKTHICIGRHYTILLGWCFNYTTNSPYGQ